MALGKLWKKKEEIKQALKICVYGENGCGKSLIALAFPESAVIDSEAKIGTYVNHSVFGKNILGVADTSSYYDSAEMIKEIVESKDKECQTLIIDSETKIYDALSVACMETEEARALKKGGDVSDQVVSQRGYGKIKLNAQRLSALKAMASSKGITVIVTAHVEDVFNNAKKPEDRVKIGERPALRKKAEHDYDIILKVTKEKDLGSGQFKYIAIPEKDTTGVFTLGQKIDCTWKSPNEPNTVIYDMLKDKIEKVSCGTKNGGYSSVDSDIQKAINESKSNDDVINEFTEIFKEFDAEKKAKVAQLLKDNGIKSYKDEATIPQLKIVVEEMKQM